MWREGCGGDVEGGVVRGVGGVVRGVGGVVRGVGGVGEAGYSASCGRVDAHCKDQ